MKRCPQCEFIYEDDQNCCDMDGIDLVFDNPTPSPTSQKPITQGKRNNSRRSLLSLFGVVFGVVIFAVGYASLERAVTVSSEPASAPQVTVSQPATQQEIASGPDKDAEEPVAEDPTVTMVSNTAKNTRLATQEPSRNLTSKTGTEPLPDNSLGTRGVIVGSVPRQTRVDSSQSQPGMIRPGTPPSAAKKDSKVVSIVKKTGRFFKKAF
ncbi:MAG: hypothetical protein WAL47_16335 [Pyrinomonadaceae bacterium]